MGDFLFVPPHGREPLQVRPHKGSLVDFSVSDLALSIWVGFQKENKQNTESRLLWCSI